MIKLFIENYRNNKMKWLKCSVISLAIGVFLIVDADGENYKSPYLNKEIAVSWRMEKLVSKLGETESFKTINAKKENITISVQRNKLPLGAVEFAFTACSSSRKKFVIASVYNCGCAKW